MRTVLQKLLHPGRSPRVRERGYAQVGGYVVRAGDAHIERPWPSYPLGFLRPVGDDIVPVELSDPQLLANQLVA